MPIVRKLDWPKLWTLRTLENDFSRRWRDEPGALQDQADEQALVYAQALAAGDMDTAAVIVGEAVDLVRSSESAANVVATIVRGAERRLHEWRGVSEDLDAASPRT